MKRYNQFSKRVNRYSELPSGIPATTDDGFLIWTGTLFTGGYVPSGSTDVNVKRIEATLFEGTWSMEEAWSTDLDFLVHSGQKTCYISYHNESGRLFGVLVSYGGNYIFELDPVNGDILYSELTNITPYAPFATGEVDSLGRFWVSIDDVLYRFNDMRDSTDRAEFPAPTSTTSIRLNFAVAPDGSFIVGEGSDWALYDSNDTIIETGQSSTTLTLGYSATYALMLDNNHIYGSSSGANNIMGKAERDGTNIWSLTTDGSDGEYNYMYNFRDDFLLNLRNVGTNCFLEKANLATGAREARFTVGSNLSVGFDVSGAQLLFTNSDVYLFSTHYRVAGAVLSGITPDFQKLDSGIDNSSGGATYSCSAIGGTNMKVML